MTFRAHPAPAAIAALLALAACTSGADDPEVTEPSPTGEAAGACRELADALPERVDGEERGSAADGMEFAATWGDPAIVLRCGVSRPALMTPGSETYDPLAEVVDVNGVSWLLEEEPDGKRFTTTGRLVFVEMTVPDAYAPEVNPLIDVAAPVDGHIPLDELYAEPEPESDSGADSGDASG
ncbi:DUF3515 domain-containing protein [Streptomyces sp. NBC_01803]|uniref:DUF3515 domain-containing protein n=1 Tax=Streptomyces sp. NBC_01803 TaxID=2975946 RepID=UPI002DDA3B08|nr:DUF3515 domain-containing protein [Streptomyces sp. NBC_01803]WSA44012.1 DUF3515 domain-containing protein [Streptomyces sp. NBC_01803]